MAGRNLSQVVGEIGEYMVSYMIVKTKNWVARLQQMDYGVDIEAELADPSPEGKLLKIQVKGTENIIIKDKLVIKRLDKEYIHKLLSYTVPVVLVIADVESEKAYYVFLHEWASRNQEALNDSTTASIDVKIPVHRELVDGLFNYLPIVAWQETLTQKQDNLLKTVAILIETKRTVIADLLQGELNDASFERDVMPIYRTLDEAKQLGNKLRGTREGNAASQKMFEVCRRYGGYFRLEDIEHLLFRDDNLSMTGLSGLSILYDYYPVHMRELGTAEYFKNKNMELYFGLYYYCRLREKYMELSEGQIAFGHKEKLDVDIEGYTLDDYFYEEVLSKYPNRGTFFLLQCVRPISPPADGYVVWSP